MCLGLLCNDFRANLVSFPGIHVVVHDVSLLEFRLHICGYRRGDVHEGFLRWMYLGLDR